MCYPGFGVTSLSLVSIFIGEDGLKFTDASIRALKAKSERYEKWELNGFGIRVFPSGKKSWVYMFRFEGFLRRMTFGSYPKLSLSQAHELHAKARQKLERGIDPGIESIQGKRQAREAYTVTELVYDYIEKHAKRKKRSWREDQRILNKDVVSRWGKRKAASITRLEVVNLLDEVRDRAEAIGGTGVQANRTLEVIRKMYNFAVGRSIVEHSPCAVIETPAKENKRDRVLNENEIKVFWNNIDKSRMERATQLLLKLQLVTMQRKGELVQIEKTDLDLKNGWWTQPKEKVKNNIAHRVWLSNMAMELIQEGVELSGDSKWVFPGRIEGKHLTPQAVGHALRDAQTNNPTRKTADVLNVSKFTPHDLRRTGATHATGAGVSRFIVSRVLNHVDQSITARYDLHEYDNEKKQALEIWERKLRSILFDEKSKVVNLKI
jgi:integrase